MAWTGRPCRSIRIGGLGGNCVIEASARTATIALDRGTAEVEFDETAGVLTVTHRRRWLHVRWVWFSALQKLLIVAFALFGFLFRDSIESSTAFTAAILLWSFPFISFWVLQMGALPGFWPIRIWVRQGTVTIGPQVVPIEDARVRLSRDGWSVGRVNVGATWGAAGGTWLVHTLNLAREGHLESLDLTSRIHARPRPFPALPGRVDFELAHDGLEATLVASERSTDERANYGWSLVPLTAGAAGAAASWLGLPTFTFIGGLLGVLAIGLAVKWRRRRLAHARQHRRVRLDAGVVHWVDGAGAHRLPLAEITRVHLGPRAIQVDRTDGTAIWLGEGWPLPALGRLTEALEDALGSPEARVSTQLPAVPETLARLRARIE